MNFYTLEKYTKEDIQYLIDFGIEESISAYVHTLLK